MPCTPPLIAGIVNRRSELLTVLDLKQFFDVPEKDYEKTAQVIVVRGAGMVIGILADEILENDHYLRNKLVAPITSTGVKKMSYIQGIYQGKVTILNIEALLEDPEIQVKLAAR